ncbi:MAG: hypothetical protein OXN89_07330 [Bryobacterales bacterium]|nr:hypothetical protein [Bryobacterales bacterium]
MKGVVCVLVLFAGTLARQAKSQFDNPTLTRPLVKEVPRGALAESGRNG